MAHFLAFEGPKTALIFAGGSDVVIDPREWSSGWKRKRTPSTCAGDIISRIEYQQSNDRSEPQEVIYLGDDGPDQSRRRPVKLGR